MAVEYLLEVNDVRKTYGGVRALNGASLALKAHEIHGLLGPNGSGKSTLNKVIAGSVEATGGELFWEGRRSRLGSPRAAYNLGIAAVYQQLSLIPHLSVRDNLELGVEATRSGFLTPRRSRAAVAEVLERFALALGPRVGLDSLVIDLNPGQQQIIEIAKAIYKQPRLLILDEATASLHRDQVQSVFSVVRELCQEGTAVVFVSHRLDEIMDLCTSATILRSGQTVATVPIYGTAEDELVRLMVGDFERSARRDPSQIPERENLLAVESLHAPGVEDVTLSVKAGEIVGLGGLQGQGQSALLLALFGSLKVTSGTIAVSGKQRRIHSPIAAAKAGFALVPGDRASQGLFAQRSVLENLSIASLASRVVAGFAVSRRRELSVAAHMVNRLRIKVGALMDPVSSLSGGNQQKVIIAKWLLTNPKVVLLDDPTKGVDISAKAEIYKIIRELADGGAAILFNSSDDRELAEVADRVVVMYEGTMRGELVGADVTYDALVSAALMAGIGDQARPTDPPAYSDGPGE